MKSLVFVILGCVPLAVLTVESLVELGSIERRPTGARRTEEINAQKAAVVKVRMQMASETRGADRLAEIDLVSMGSGPELDKQPADSRLRPLADAWRGWKETHDLLNRFLRIDRSASTNDPDRLQETVKQLENLRGQCLASASGSPEFLELLDRRMAECNHRLKASQRLREAENLVGQARKAFLEQRYQEAVKACDQWLSRYAMVVDASVTERMRLLRQRAEFWDENLQLISRLGGAASLTDRQQLLVGFLTKYPEHSSRTAAEREVLQRRKGDLDDVKARIVEEEKGRRAADLVAGLERKASLNLPSRLKEAAEIVRRYPTASVKTMLSTRVDQWLREILPEKTIDESPLLQEAETPRHEIVRGFFRTIKMPDGEILGYKCYETYEELLDPKAEVGTYRPEELLGVPGESLPRRLVMEYNEARRQLIAHAGQKDRWLRFAELCETLESRLSEYRRKLGRSQEPLSFVRESRFAREMAASGCSYLTELLGP